MKGITSGGERLPGELVADTIEELRAMLPPGLRRHDRSAYDPVGTVEAWDDAFAFFSDVRIVRMLRNNE